MNENDTSAVVSAEPDADDVEAHGIREVMVGLSAAAVLTGGVAAVVNSDDGPGASGRASISADAAGTDLTDARLASAQVNGGGTAVQREAKADAGDATSVLGVRSTGGLAKAPTADDADDVQAPTYLGSQLDRADAAADSTVAWTRDVRDRTVDTTRETVGDARANLRTAPATAIDAVEAAPGAVLGTVPDVGDVRSTVRDTARAATTATSAAVDSTIVLAGDLVRGVEGTATTMIARVQPQAGVGVDTSNAGGWVTLSVGGEQIARAEVRDGQATLSYTAPRADAPITVAYSGSDVLRATSITL